MYTCMYVARVPNLLHCNLPPVVKQQGQLAKIFELCLQGEVKDEL